MTNKLIISKHKNKYYLITDWEPVLLVNYQPDPEDLIID